MLDSSKLLLRKVIFKHEITVDDVSIALLNEYESGLNEGLKIAHDSFDSKLNEIACNLKLKGS